MAVAAPTKPTRRRRVQQRTLETRAAILDAALSEFADRGFDGATTRGIAQLAGVHHPVIAHHFGSKDALWKATAEHVFGRYAARIQERRDAAGSADEAVSLRLLLRQFILFSAELPAFHRFMLQANRGDPKRLAWLVRRFLGPGSAIETGVIASSQRAGVLREGDALHLRYAFIGAATSIFSMAGEFELVTGKSPFDAATIDRHVDLVLRLFENPHTDTDPSED